MKEIGNNLLVAIMILAFAAIMIVLLLTGCHSDNRVRIKPTLDYKISPAKKEMLRLHVTRELWAQKQLRHYEEGRK